MMMEFTFLGKLSHLCDPFGILMFIYSWINVIDPGWITVGFCFDLTDQIDIDILTSFLLA